MRGHYLQLKNLNFHRLKSPLRQLTVIGCCFLWTTSAFTTSMSLWNNHASLSSSQTAKSSRALSTIQDSDSDTEAPLYIQEGLFAVEKPLEWTSQQVVGKIRSILEKDAKARNVPDRRKKRRRPWMKVGHGGTLDPLASGVLVIGVGKGTKELQRYLTGSKGYQAGVELGFQTTTLDLDTNGEVVERKPFDHVTHQAVEDILSQFRGTIQQKPPIFRYVAI